MNISDIVTSVTDLAGNKIAEIIVTEVTRMGDAHYVFSATASVDRGSSVGHHKYTFNAEAQTYPNPLGILRAALNALEDEYVLMDGEVVDSADGEPDDTEGRTADLARRLGGEVRHLPAEEERGLRYHRPAIRSEQSVEHGNDS